MARVTIDLTAHEFYKELSEKGANRPALFKTMKDLFMFCFAVGARNGIRRPLVDRVDVFSTEAFDVDLDIPVLAGVYLGEVQNLLVLDAQQDERLSLEVLKAAEEFANAGVVIVRDEFRSIEPERSLMMLLTVGV